ncbi:MAG TPA: glycosyltransferase [Vicinamibacterales bacterium]
MRVVVLCHSLRSDWNHGNAHFLRGICRDLLRRGHEVVVLEPANGWSALNLTREAGMAGLDAYRAAYPELESSVYDPSRFDADAALDGADLVIVHEWTDPAIVHAVGRYRRRACCVLLFHDTHHRSVSSPDEIDRLDLSDYDGVLAFGAAVADQYVARRLAANVWVWHEAADVSVFAPREGVAREADVVWIGNWGDDERTAELHEFLLEPVRALGLGGSVHGVRYPAGARESVARAGLAYHGWLPNHAVPEVFARHRVTVHIPRRPYADALPGIPTIRVFEALACGIPLVCAPWTDSEGLFTPGADYLVARDGADMRAHLRSLTSDAALADAIARHGRHTVLTRHTCRHRVDELLAIVSSLAGAAAATPHREVEVF